ncbi:hypothetical protein SEUCBS139899_002112 [Sporothrix eucalyptigena]|uniref:RCC1-like domain-containing protein n=1 Tax=Sporothrix eucalyptigena TaxID=1812306 RepID=A0ABP0D285_9PEZI
MATRTNRKHSATTTQSAGAPTLRATKRARVAEPAQSTTTRNLLSRRQARQPQTLPGTSLDPTSSLPVINHVPTEVLDVLVFGNGENSELGLGPSRTETSIPRVNPFLHAGTESNFHVVQLDCGGMHTIALTKSNQIVTWGVNDNGALGRSTEWSGGLRDMDDENDDGEDSKSDDDGNLNPLESTPTAISTSSFPPNTTFVQVAAGDSCSLALTDKGLVFGWGTFTMDEGKTIFSYDTEKDELVEKQMTPTLIKGLSGITQIACGANHALALDAIRGIAYTWGRADQNQLGRRITSFPSQGEPANLFFLPGLIPGPVPIPNIRYIATGEHHAFAIDHREVVWGWGYNGFNETGADPQHAGKEDADNILPYPKPVKTLSGHKIAVLDGGQHHSVAVTADGRCLAWGQMDCGQLGIEFRNEQLFDKSLIRNDERGKPRICLKPTVITGPIGLVRHVACGTDHTIIVSRDGAVYATGFNANGQLGLGHEDDVYVAQRLAGKATVSRRFTWAGAGGQFSVVAGPHRPSPAT